MPLSDMSPTCLTLAVLHAVAAVHNVPANLQTHKQRTHHKPSAKWKAIVTSTCYMRSCTHGVMNSPRQERPSHLGQAAMSIGDDMSQEHLVPSALLASLDAVHGSYTMPLLSHIPVSMLRLLR
jgi:hypothetical protein